MIFNHSFDPDVLGVARGILDHQLIDRCGTRCGKVDDVLLHERGGTLAVAGISTGPGAAARRLHSRAAAWALTRFGAHETWIAWSETTGLTDHIALAREFDEYGLGRGEQRAARIIDQLPWRTLGPEQRRHLDASVSAGERSRPHRPVVRLSALLGTPLRGPGGTQLGRVHELVAKHDGDDWIITDVEAGPAALVMRLGLPLHLPDRHDPTRVVDWSANPLVLGPAT